MTNCGGGDAIIIPPSCKYAFIVISGRKSNMYCPNCGKWQPEDSRFCESCGTKIVFDTEPEDISAADTSGSGGNTPPDKKFPVKPLIIIMAAVIVVLVIVILFFVLKRKDSDTEQAVSTETEETAEETAAEENEEADEKEAEVVETSYCYITTSVYDEDGSSILYGDETYTNGILTSESWDYAAYNEFTDSGIELEAYEVTTAYTEDGDLLSVNDHREYGEEIYEYVTECTYEYDSDGRPISGTYYDNWWYDEEADMEISYDENGEVSRLALETYEDDELYGCAVVFTRDDDSCTVSFEEYDNWDGEIDSYTFGSMEYYFEDGQISSIVVIEGDSGYLAEYAYGLMNILYGTRQYFTAFTYDALYDGDSSIELQYDEYGNCIRESYNSYTGDSDERTYSYTYDENENITQCIFSDEGEAYYSIAEYRYE